MKPLRVNDLVLVSRNIEAGLRTGRDFRTCLRWLSKNAKNIRISEFATRLDHEMSFQTWEQVVNSFRGLRRSPLEQIFFEILSQSRAGVHHLSSVLSRFREVLATLLKLERESRSLLLLPKVQAGVAIVVGLSFGIVMPLLSPQMFPSFLTRGRADLLMAGLSGLALGTTSLWWISVGPLRRIEDSTKKILFFSMQVVLIRSGLDFVTAWNRALEAIRFPSHFFEGMRFQLSKSQTLQQRLLEIEEGAPQSWKEVLVSLRWVLESGAGVSDWLDEVCKLERERFESESLYLLKRLSLLTMIPVQIIIFPSSVFLLLGPQLLEILSSI